MWRSEGRGCGEIEIDAWFTYYLITTASSRNLFVWKRQYRSNLEIISDTFLFISGVSSQLYYSCVSCWVIKWYTLRIHMNHGRWTHLLTLMIQDTMDFIRPVFLLSLGYILSSFYCRVKWHQFNDIFVKSNPNPMVSQQGETKNIRSSRGVLWNCYFLSPWLAWDLFS